MISVAEARDRILAPLRPTATETIALADAWGRVLASPAKARLTHPPENVSAMDGYALRASDAKPGRRLRVAGAAPAGHPFSGALGPDEAVRVFTGSVIPENANSVLLQEDAILSGEYVEVRESCSAGRHIRPAGQDFRVGDVLLQSGRRLGARDIGLAAASNHAWLTVHRRPRIAILATGDEIALPGDPVRPGGIVSSNSHALSALVRAGGGEPVLLPIVGDDANAISAVVDSLGGLDMLVTTGGASVGEHDLVQAALSQRGFERDFWKVAMRPGKPLIAGRVCGVPVIGLPGNPVSALICAALFLLPSLDVLAGLPAASPRVERAALGEALAANDGRADHLRAKLVVEPSGLQVATAFSRQDSGMMSLLAQADALILRAPYAPALAVGAEVEVIRLESFGL